MKKKNSGIVITRKIQIEPIGDSKNNNVIHKYVENAQEAQYRAKNLLIGQMGALFYKHDQEITTMDLKKAVSVSSNPILAGIEFPKGLDLKSLVFYHLNSEFDTARKNGLARGERTLSNYKKGAPIYTSGRNLHFIFEFDDDAMENYKLNPTESSAEERLLRSMKVTLHWVNKKDFIVNPGNSMDLRRLLFKIFTGEYSFGEGKVQVLNNKNDKKGMEKMMLLLSVKKPITLAQLDEDTVVGVDIGAKNPAVCALNNDTEARMYCGDNFAMLKIHEEHLSRRKEEQVKSIFNKSKHGRKKKLKKASQHNTKERDKAKTANHKIAKQVVQFALDHNAKYINLEYLEGYFKIPENADKRKLWSYYEIQTMIKNKAAQYGIEVRMVDSFYTSQVCSFCGSDKEGQLIDRDRFICKNPDCISHKFKSTFIESDFNAARNIAKSTNWAKTKKKEKTDEEQKSNNEE